jgi:hypothetical protein
VPVSAKQPGGSDSVGPLLRYFDVVVLVVAAPIMLLIGVPALGYAVGAGAWILLRAVGVAVDHLAETSPDMSRAVGLRLGFMLGRLFLLALAVILARKAGTKGDGLTALVVIVLAYTTYLALSAVTRPRRSAHRSTPRST